MSTRNASILELCDFVYCLNEWHNVKPIHLVVLIFRMRRRLPAMESTAAFKHFEARLSPTETCFTWIPLTAVYRWLSPSNFWMFLNVRAGEPIVNSSSNAGTRVFSSYQSACCCRKHPLYIKRSWNLRDRNTLKALFKRPSRQGTWYRRGAY